MCEGKGVSVRRHLRRPHAVQTWALSETSFELQSLLATISRTRSPENKSLGGPSSSFEVLELCATGFVAASIIED